MDPTLRLSSPRWSERRGGDGRYIPIDWDWASGRSREEGAMLERGVHELGD